MGKHCLILTKTESYYFNWTSNTSTKWTFTRVITILHKRCLWCLWQISSLTSANLLPKIGGCPISAYSRPPYSHCGLFMASLFLLLPIHWPPIFVPFPCPPLDCSRPCVHRAHLPTAMSLILKTALFGPIITTPSSLPSSDLISVWYSFLSFWEYHFECGIWLHKERYFPMTHPNFQNILTHC